MPAFFNQPDGSNTCCEPCDRSGPCEDCATPEASFECVSRQGNGTLRGWSKFQNQNDGDVNLRKFTKATMSGWDQAVVHNGFATWECTGGPPCTDICTGPVGVVEWFAINEEESLFDVSTNTQSQRATCSLYQCGNIEDTLLYNWNYPNMTAITLADQSLFEVSDLVHGCSFASNYGTVPCGDSPIGSNCPGVGGVELVSYSVNTYSTLSEPDTLAAALARGTPTVGTSCTTSAGTIGTTSAGSSSQITVTGARSVTATITMLNVVSGSDYEITVTLEKYDTSAMSTVEVGDVVTVTADATGTDTYDYQVPVETGYEYTITGVAIAHA